MAVPNALFFLASILFLHLFPRNVHHGYLQAEKVKIINRVYVKM